MESSANPAERHSGARWKPSVTVAAIIEQDGRYLLVEENTAEGLRLNNPAGHLDPGESPLQGVLRETFEATARQFTAPAVLGIYLSRFQRQRIGQQEFQLADLVTAVGGR